MKIREHLIGPEDGRTPPVWLTMIMITASAVAGVVADRHGGFVLGVLTAAAMGLLITAPWVLLTARRAEE